MTLITLAWRMLLFITWFLAISLLLDPNAGSKRRLGRKELVILLCPFIDRQKLEEHLWPDKHFNQAFGAASYLKKSGLGDEITDFIIWAPNAWFKCLSVHMCSSSFCLSMKAQRSITNSIQSGLLHEPVLGSKSKLTLRNHVIKSNIR